MGLIQLIEGINTGVCWDEYELEHGSLISTVIADIQKVASPDIKARYIPSHTYKKLIVGPVKNHPLAPGLVDQFGIGIQASTGGVKYFGLEEYYLNPKCEIWSCRPQGLTSDSIKIMFETAARLVAAKMGYNYLGLGGDAVEGATGIDRLFPRLYKVANPLDDAHDAFCSECLSMINSACPEYAGIDLYKIYIDSKISPEASMYEFPYDRRICIKTAD